MKVCSERLASKSDPACAPEDMMLFTRMGTTWLEMFVIVVRLDAILFLLYGNFAKCQISQ